MDNEKLRNENLRLKNENKELKRIIEEQKLIDEQIRLKEENNELKNIIIKNKDNEYDNNFVIMPTNSEEKENAEEISLLNRSEKRIKVLESLEKRSKIPSKISRDINDSSYNISKYLKTLKEYDLVVCLNENDKRYRYYKITDKGRKYLNIIKDKKTPHSQINK